jgi:ribosomal protein S18 acetylase RimI-like enzyme
MPNPLFRYAELADVPALHALIERAYRGDEAAATWTNEAELMSGPRTDADELAELIAAEDHRFVLAEIDGVLVGAALIERRGELGYFGMFSIDPGLQAQGIGRLMLAELEARARELWGSSGMMLWVINVREELIGWYQRRGYVLTGKREPFPPELRPKGGKVLDFIEMKKVF